MDHPDYFKSLEDIYLAFLEYIQRVPVNGYVVYCHDDKGCLELIKRARDRRTDINYIPYGTSAPGDYKISALNKGSGVNSFVINRYKGDFQIKIPGHHTILDACGSIAVASILLELEGLNPDILLEKIKQGVLNFSGTKRRSEYLGEFGGIIFMDDYAHHPTAIETTLKGLRDFYPDRRLIVDFMSHTYTRTGELLQEFASSFSSSHIVILNKIYSSAREKYTGGITGETLFWETQKHHNNVIYAPEYSDAVIELKKILRPGDLFITMGAGNNWQVGQELIKEYRK